MPPVRRARHADPTESPYPDGWLSYRRRRRRRRRLPVESDVSGGAPPSATTLPDDVLFGIFSRVSGLTDVARCAATCRRWGRVVTTRAAPISRALPPPPGGFQPHLAIGVFLQQHHEKDDAGRRLRCARGGRAAQLRFLPTAFASRLVGPFTGSVGAASFDDARPVASRNGRVVLQLERGNGLTLCVWNPMTGDVAMLPTLSGKEFPGDDYACAILTGDDDLDVPLCLPGFFRLLLVYGRRGFTALRSYSSDTCSWGLECKKPGAKISGRVLRQLGPAVVLHGVAYWFMPRDAFGVRLGSTAAATTMDVCSVPYYMYRRTGCKLDEYVLGVTADGRLNIVDIVYVGGRFPAVSFRTSLFHNGVVGDGRSDDDEDFNIDLPEIKVTWTTRMKPWWFGEKSGTLIFTVEETSRTSVVYALNVATRSLEKLADGVSNHTCCRRMYGYEMDRAALLASVASHH